MSDSSSVGARDQVSEAWRSHRPYLVNLAYQMLGDVGEAEDIAQEAFCDWHGLTKTKSTTSAAG
jgi:RNA polymerase sigma-70 factor (ECF subfamily)